MTNEERLLLTTRSSLAHLPDVVEKKMFGKQAFMIKGKLCIALGKEEIMCRIDPALNTSSLDDKECKPVIMRGREMKGYVYVKNEYLQTEEKIDFWINLCLEFNKTIT